MNTSEVEREIARLKDENLNLKLEIALEREVVENYKSWVKRLHDEGESYTTNVHISIAWISIVMVLSVMLILSIS